jgi:4-amino-4-deoxy-L-arabinose transferase-like glycosyltransferase
MALASSAVPVCIGLLARQLYDRRVALVAVIFASLYFPFIDVFALFISEGPFLVFIFPAFIALVHALRGSGRSARIAAFAAGLGFGLATMARPVAVVWLALSGLLLTVWLARKETRRWALTAGLLGAGALLVLVPTSIRCTRLNEGRFCMSGTIGPLNVVLGHLADARRVVWRDLRDNTYFYASSPVSYQSHATREVSLPFAAEDGAANMAYARKLFTDDPVGFFWQSIDEMCFLIAGNYPWPTYETAWRRWGMTAERLLWVLVMIPAIFTVRRRWRALSRLSREAQAEALLLVPLAGSIVVSLMTVGETRYRVACDGFMMILAAAAWVRSEAPR